jgi:hypothetical protein
MDIVLAGRAEAAFVEALMNLHAPSILKNYKDYEKNSIYRRASSDLFERSLSIVILSNNLYAPPSFWEFPARLRPLVAKLVSDEPDPASIDNQLPSILLGPEKKNDASHLASFALSANIFSPGTLQALRLPPSQLEVSPAASILRGFTGVDTEFGSVHRHAHSYLQRMISQVNSAEAKELTLVLTRSDQKLLAMLVAFFKGSRCPLPFAFPDLTIDDHIVDEQLSGELANLKPEGLAAAATMKQTQALRPYIEVIDALFRRRENDDIKGGLQKALRRARASIPMIRQAAATFPVASLHYHPHLPRQAKPQSATMAGWMERKLWDHETHVLTIDD